MVALRLHGKKCRGSQSLRSMLFTHLRRKFLLIRVQPEVNRELPQQRTKNINL